ncbi:MAG: hypothetical protein AB4372_29840 [Xenococcus sp. (in: cyanobacteria)]
MTNDKNENSDQLQKITQNLASITSALGTLSNIAIDNRDRINTLEQYASQSVARLESLERLAEGLALNAQNQNNTQQSILETQTTLARTIEQVTQQQAQLIEQQAQLITNQAETRAAIEKIDRVLDYLMRRDGDRDQN